VSRATFRLSTDECGRCTNLNFFISFPLKFFFGLMVFSARYAFSCVAHWHDPFMYCMECRVKGRTGFPVDQFFRDDVLSVFY
jgi:hypothetical protein